VPKHIEGVAHCIGQLGKSLNRARRANAAVLSCFAGPDVKPSLTLLGAPPHDAGMRLGFHRIAIVGATGATGREIATQLVSCGERVRVISRRLDVLKTMFRGSRFEHRQGDALDMYSLLDAIADCDLVIDCIGLRKEELGLHPKVASSLATAIRRSGARCVQLSSYWSYIPIAKLPVSEDSPRANGPLWAQHRRQAEDILIEAGAAVAQLPDFFGPHVQESALQNPLRDAVAGRPMNWVGNAAIEREYIYVPDAMSVVAELAFRSEAYGQRWIIPGSGPISAAKIAQLTSGLLGREVKLRCAGPRLLQLMSFFRQDLHDIMQLVPTYAKPVRYDGSKLQNLLGRRKSTPYEIAIERTLAAINAGG
jgi:nucleoside-diphosphate-sugar epimerase